MRGCRRARASILRLVDGSLPLEERFLLEEHLAACPACEERQERALGIEEALARLPEPGDARIDVEAAVVAVRRALASGEAPGRPRSRRAPILAAAVAAVVVLGLGLLALRGEFPGTGAGSPPADDPPIPRAAQAAPDAPAGPAPGPATLAEAERAVRQGLLEALPAGWDPLADDDAGTFLARFEERSVGLFSWPLPRLVERHLEDPDPAVAGAASRYLGLRGDRLSAVRLGAVLGRADVGPAAVRALGDLGTPGIPALARALADPVLSGRALVQLARIGGPEAAGAIADALRPGTDPERRETLLDALAETGPAAVEPLLWLASREDRGAPSALLWLGAVEGGPDELARLLRSRRLDLPVELLLEAAARLQPPGGLAWVEERVQEFRNRPAALACLVRWAGTAPLESLLRLDAGGRLPDADLIATFDELAGRDPERVTTLARELTSGSDPLRAGRYLELLLASGQPAVAPALVHFVHSALVPDDERQWAALAIGDIGREEDALLLLRGLPLLGPEDRRLYAACLITIRRLLGEPGVARAIEGFPRLASRQVLSALEGVAEEGTGAVSWGCKEPWGDLSRVARALDGALDSRNAKTRNPAL